MADQPKLKIENIAPDDEDAVLGCAAQIHSFSLPNEPIGDNFQKSLQEDFGAAADFIKRYDAIKKALFVTLPTIFEKAGIDVRVELCEGQKDLVYKTVRLALLEEGHLLIYRNAEKKDLFTRLSGALKWSEKRNILETGGNLVHRDGAWHSAFRVQTPFNESNVLEAFALIVAHDARMEAEANLKKQQAKESPKAEKKKGGGFLGLGK